MGRAWGTRDTVSMQGAIENVSTYVIDLNLYMIVFHRVRPAALWGLSDARVVHTPTW